MMNQDDHADERFDALLRDLGPDVPHPELPLTERGRLLAMLSDSGRTQQLAPSRPGHARWRAAAGIGLVASLGLSSLLLGFRLSAATDELARSRWEAGETLELLRVARFAQASIPVPADLGDLDPEDLVLITFDHELCPIARGTTPAFRTLAADHPGDAARFLILDVTGEHRAQAAEQIDALRLGYSLLTPLGGETGVVKVLDASHGRVVCSAPGQRGIEQAETVLARVSQREGAP